MPPAVWATLLAETAPAEWMQPEEDPEDHDAAEGAEQVSPETVAEVLNHRLFRAVVAYTASIRGLEGSRSGWSETIRATVIGTVRQSPVLLIEHLRRVSSARPQGP